MNSGNEQQIDKELYITQQLSAIPELTSMEFEFVEKDIYRRIQLSGWDRFIIKYGSPLRCMLRPEIELDKQIFLNRYNLT